MHTRPVIIKPKPQKVPRNETLRFTKKKDFEKLLAEMEHSKVKRNPKIDYINQNIHRLDIFPYDEDAHTYNKNLSSVCSISMFKLQHQLEHMIAERQECQTVKLSSRSLASNRTKPLEDYSPSKESGQAYLEMMAGDAHTHTEDDFVYTSHYSTPVVVNEINGAWQHIFKNRTRYFDPRKVVHQFYHKHGVSKKGIPAFYHILWLDCSRKFTLKNFLSLVSLAKNAGETHLIMFHTECKMVSNYWTLAKCYLQHKIGKRFLLVRLRPPSMVWGNSIVERRDRIEVYKLMVMFSVGGIVIDPDVITLSPYDALRRHHLPIPIMVKDNRYELSTSFMASKPNTVFMARWYWAYKTFKTWLTSVQEFFSFPIGEK